jgi:hypothetical protein
MPSPAPTVLMRMSLRDAIAQVRRMGNSHRIKKEAADFDAAEVSALFHLQEAQRLMDKIAEAK